MIDFAWFLMHLMMFVFSVFFFIGTGGEMSLVSALVNAFCTGLLFEKLFHKEVEL